MITAEENGHYNVAWDPFSEHNIRRWPLCWPSWPSLTDVLSWEISPPCSVQWSQLPVLRDPKRSGNTFILVSVVSWTCMYCTVGYQQSQGQSALFGFFFPSSKLSSWWHDCPMTLMQISFWPNEICSSSGHRLRNKKKYLWIFSCNKKKEEKNSLFFSNRRL